MKLGTRTTAQYLWSGMEERKNGGTDSKIHRSAVPPFFRFAFLPVMMTLTFNFFSTSLQSQTPPTPPARPQKSPVSVPDTTASMEFITPGSFYEPEQVVVDTLDYSFVRYDPARRDEYPYATTGNLGSPARRLYFTIPFTKGLTTGHSAFDLYKSDFDNFRFYDTRIALTRLEYSQGLSQEDAITRAAFGRNFAKGINLSVNYQRINQKGQFQMQRAKNTAFGIGVLYRAPKGKIDGIYHYMSNSVVHEENGGIESAEILLDTIDLNINIPVRLSGALTTHRMRDITVQHHLHLLASDRDTVVSKSDLDIIHTFNYGSAFVKFADSEINGAEPEYYDRFVTDDRGMRNFVHTNTLDNSVDVQFRYAPASVNVPAHILRTGMQWRAITVNQEPETFNRTELFLNVAGQLGISKHLSLDGNGYLGFIDASGEYRLLANARLKLFKDATTWGRLRLYQRRPTLTESLMFVDQIEVWRTDFRNISLSSLEFHYVQPSIRLKLHGAAHLLSNFIYLDSSRMPVQLTRDAEVLQISASKEVNLGPIGLLAHLMLQEYDVNEMALPHLIFNSQLFYSGRMFKKNLLVRAGVDLLLTDTYTGVSWFPVTGQFYYDDDFSISQYPALDVFASMQVKDIFKAFVKMENVTVFLSNDHYFQIKDYPQFEQNFRFGLWMRLFD